MDIGIIIIVSVDTNTKRGNFNSDNENIKMNMKREKMSKIEIIAKRFAVKISDVNKDKSVLKNINMSREHFKERAFSVRDEIILGEYKDKVIRYFAFLHELGHIENGKKGADNLPKIIQEIEAWLFAVRFYKKDIPLKVIAYILKSLKTHIPR